MCIEKLFIHRDRWTTVRIYGNALSVIDQFLFIDFIFHIVVQSLYYQYEYYKISKY